MSGICAVWRDGDSSGVSRILADVTAGLTLDRSEQTSRAAEGGAGVGVSARFPTQQLHRGDGLLIACDADIQNEEELSSDLPQPRRGTTAALIAALYRQFDSGFLEKLRGSFSIVIWDRSKGRLLAAVDPFGIGRLVYHQGGGAFMVASRIDALLHSGEVDTSINGRSILNILNFGANLAPETIFTRVQRVPPGSYVLVSEGSLRTVSYWEMRYGPSENKGEAELSSELEAVMAQSVGSCCKNEAPDGIGAFLSGGTDSSTVVGLMSRVLPSPVRAYSIGFEEQQFNELEYATLAAQHFGAEHNTYLVSARDCFEALPSMVRYFDEPFGNSSAIPTYFCARMAAQSGIKVLLAGDGGDELFAGNERYLTDKIFRAYHGIPGPLRRGIIEPALRFVPLRNGLVGKARSYVRRANMTPVHRFFSYQFLAAHPPAEIFTADFLQTVQGYDVLETPSRYYDCGPAQDHLDRLLYVDVKITLGDNDLPKVTCMSELAGIRTRFPFLDSSVAGFSGRVPVGLKVKGGEKRYLFKQAFRKLLPAEIIKKTKHGFGIPVATWLKSDPSMRELAHDVLLSRAACERGYFRPEFTRRLFEMHERDDTSYYGDTLWTFLMLELWHRQVVDKPVRMAI